MANPNKEVSNSTLYLIAIGMLVVVVANVLIAYFSDNLWRNLAVGLLLGILIAVITYVAVKRDLGSK